MRRIDPRHLVCRQQPERRFARPEGTERGVARREGGARVAHLRIVVALRPAEVARIDAAAVPREVIGIGRARILAAAERRMTLGMLLLLPLVYFHRADQPKRSYGNAEFRIAQRRHRLHLAVDVDELAFVGRVNPRGLDGDNQTLPSASDRSVCTARPSFQNSRTLEPASRTSPNSTAAIDLPMRANHDVRVRSVKLSPTPDIGSSPTGLAAMVAARRGRPTMR